MADLKGRVALVTGASGGVGKGIAEGLAEAGATIYLTGSSDSLETLSAQTMLQATARCVDELGGKGISIPLDHRNDGGVLALFRRIEAQAGRLDLLVNADGISDPPAWRGAFWEHPISMWDDRCGAGLRGYFVAAAYAARLMVLQRSGLIVNISPVGGTEYMFNTSYGVCKAGVDRMARDMSVELASYDVAALSLTPGAIGSEFAAEALERGVVEMDAARLQSPRYSGRCVAALAMDPDILEKSGGCFRVAELAREYRFTEPKEGK